MPEDVSVQVLVQAPRGLDRANLRSDPRRASEPSFICTTRLRTAQRRVVFGMDKEGVKQIAVHGAELMREYASEYPGTQMGLPVFAGKFQRHGSGLRRRSLRSGDGSVAAHAEESGDLQLARHGGGCNAQRLCRPNRVDVPQHQESRIHRPEPASAQRPRHRRGRDGTGLLAGADRVEGTLFGNGERTGNVDIVTVAMNLYTHGIDPRLDFSNINEVIECAERCNRMPVHARHPYAASWSSRPFPARIRTPSRKASQRSLRRWPIGKSRTCRSIRKDIGRTYDAVIRVNSQSGKGGVAYLLESDYGIRLPRALQIEFSRIIQRISDSTGGEVTSPEIWAAFKAGYIDQRSPFAHRDHRDDSSDDSDRLTATVSEDGVDHVISGVGNGPIEAFIDGFRREFGVNVRIVDYEEHAIGSGAHASAVCFVEAQVGDAGSVFGVGMHGNIVTASLNAIVSAVNRAMRGEEELLPQKIAAESIHKIA